MPLAELRVIYFSYINSIIAHGIILEGGGADFSHGKIILQIQKRILTELL
jgi:hypothetical protein